MLYEYSCHECEKVYEVQMPLSRHGEEVKCPHCDKPLERHISPVYFTIKGDR